jgi:hypothetical protein
MKVYGKLIIIFHVRDEMGRACKTNRGEGECIEDICGKVRR